MYSNRNFIKSPIPPFRKGSGKLVFPWWKQAFAEGENVETARFQGGVRQLADDDEWWYWLKKEGEPEIWEQAKTVF